MKRKMGMETVTTGDVPKEGAEEVEGAVAEVHAVPPTVVA